MTGASAAARSGRIALTVVGLVLAWFAVRGAAERLLNGPLPAAAAAFSPADGTSQANLALARVLQGAGVLDGQSRSLYRSALTRAPLSSTALELAGLDASQAGDLARAQQLMEAARRRNPRDVLSSIWLFNHYVHMGAFAQALQAVGPIWALSSTARPIVQMRLETLLTSNSGRTALANELRLFPSWRNAFLATAAENEAVQLAATQLVLVIPPWPDAATRNRERASVLIGLLAHGRAAASYAAWRRLYDLPAFQGGNVVFNGGFVSDVEAPPFDWTLTANDRGRAEMVQDTRLPGRTGLSLYYYGEAPAELAAQSFHLQPGAYQLRLIARSDPHQAGTGLVKAILRCGQTDLTAIPLESAGPQPRRLLANFNIVPDCPLTTLSIGGTPADASGTVSVQLTGVTITPLTSRTAS